MHSKTAVRDGAANRAGPVGSVNSVQRIAEVERPRPVRVVRAGRDHRRNIHLELSDRNQRGLSPGGYGPGTLPLI